MFWFRLAFGFNLVAAFVWDLGVCAGILAMCTQGSNQQSMEQDPTKNGTISVYVFILIFQFLLAFSALSAFVICFRIWRNQYQLDKKLRSHFIMWFVSWVISLLGILAIGIYAIVRSKDPQGQLGFMYEIFQRNSQQLLFVAAFERFQRGHSCCGIYGPDDWLMVQLQQQPGTSAFTALDFGMQMNPSTGKCHLLPPTIPVGCGKVLMFVVNKVVRMYAVLTMIQLTLGIAAGVLAWYCFFYWLEEEVMILPTDELCEIIVVEPPDGSVTKLEEYNLEDQEQEPYYEEMPGPSRRYLGGGSAGVGAGTRRTYLHSFIDHEGKHRSYIVGGEAPGTRRDLSVHGSQMRERSIMPYHDREQGHSHAKHTRSRVRTRIYLTRSQLEAERHRPASERIDLPVVSRRTIRRTTTQSRNRRLDEDEEQRRAAAAEHRRQRSRDSPTPRHESVTRSRRVRSRHVSVEEIEEDGDEHEHGHSVRREPLRRSTSSTESRNESQQQSVGESRSSIESTPVTHGGRGSRSSSSRRRTDGHDNDNGHSYVQPPPRSTSRSRPRPVEARVLYKNRNALDRTDSR